MAISVKDFAPERRHGAADRRSGAGGTPKRKLNTLDWIALVVLIISGINWGLIGLINYDFVATFFDPMRPPTRSVYAAIGACALYSIYSSIKMFRS